MIARTASFATTVGSRIVKPWRGTYWFLFLIASSVSGQQPGDTVRVSGEQVGVVVEADSAGLLLSFGYAPYAGMQRLEVWGGTGNNAGRGFKYGFMAGAISVGALGTFYCGGMGCPASDYGQVLLDSVGAGLLAGVVGLLIGSAFETDIWRPVAIPGGLSLRLAVGGRSPY